MVGEAGVNQILFELTPEYWKRSALLMLTFHAITDDLLKTGDAAQN